MAKLIGIDVGTSALKGIAIDEKGSVTASSSHEYDLQVPQSGWAEQAPDDWWAAAEKCLCDLNAENADAIGLTGQMHGSVFLDRDGNVIRPALLWCDQRTTKECAEIEEKVGPEKLRQITGNPALTGFQLPKILWLRNNEPEAFARLAKVLLPKDFIRYRMTGVMATEVSDASGVGALDVRARNWSQEVFEALDLDPGLFPEVFESAEASSRWNGIPVAGGGGDQAAAAVGTGAVVPGITSISLGTSGVCFSAMDQLPTGQADAVHDFCHATGKWHRMGVMLSCGGSVRWARDVFYPGEGYENLNQEAASVEPGSEGLIFAPFLAGERCPVVDPFIRGSFAGIGMNHTRGHFARSVLEGVTFGLRQCLDLMTGGEKSRVVRVTGGGVKSQLWLTILSDVFECECELLETDEGPAFGAALLGGLSAGVWQDLNEATSACIRVRKVVKPTGIDYSKSVALQRSLYPALKSWH